MSVKSANRVGHTYSFALLAGTDAQAPTRFSPHIGAMRGVGMSVALSLRLR